MRKSSYAGLFFVWLQFFYADFRFLTQCYFIHFAANINVHHGVCIHAQAGANFKTRIIGFADFFPKGCLDCVRAFAAALHSFVDEDLGKSVIEFLGQANGLIKDVLSTNVIEIECTFKFWYPGIM